MGRAVGSLFPLMIGMSSQSMALGEAIGIFAGTAYGVMILAALTLPETAGKKLES
jgi:hypothetical protein